MTEYVMPKIALEKGQTVSKLGSDRNAGIAYFKQYISSAKLISIDC